MTTKKIDPWTIQAGYLTRLNEHKPHQTTPSSTWLVPKSCHLLDDNRGIKLNLNTAKIQRHERLSPRDRIIAERAQFRLLLAHAKRRAIIPTNR